jgi:TolA-binding protein
MQKAEKNINSTHDKVKKLEAQIAELSKAIDDLNVNTGGATSKMKADLTMLLKQLEVNLERLAAEMDESQYRMRQLERKIDMISTQRLLITGSVGDSLGPADSSDSPGVKKTKTAKVVAGLDIENLYNQARGDFLTGKYSLAFKGFKTVFEKDKAGSFKDNALYWMGECKYKEEKFDQAEEYYNRCIKEYPLGNKICSAMFKLGMVKDKKEKKKERNKIWKTMIEKCPGSNEAHRARQIMEE